jgi:nitrogen regulatory protein PII
MQPIKRIEIIANSHETSRILERMEKAGAPGYTLIRDVAGKSQWGSVDDDLPVTMLGNSYIISFCPEEKVQAIVDAVKPVLDKYGGVCYVSDAMSVPTAHRSRPA